MTGRIGFIGLGDMGKPMAGRLADAGLNPLVWSRRRTSGDPVIARGAEWADSVDAIFSACDRVVLMLANGQAIDEVLGRDTPEFSKRVVDVTVIHMGTTPPRYSEALEAEIISAGGRYAEIPVSGSTGPATSGNLVGMAAGDSEALEAAEDIVTHMCRVVVPCGEVPKALQMKLSVNTYLVALTTGLFEAFNLARTSGLDLQLFSKVLEAGPMNCDVMRMKLPKLLNGDYTPQGTILNAGDNVQMIVDEGARVGASVPMAQTNLRLYDKAARIGLGDEDMIAITKVLAGGE